MGTKWKKIKMAISSNLCVHVPTTVDESPAPSDSFSGTALLSPVTNWKLGSPKFLSKSLSRSSSKKTCTICLGSMKRGEGQAIFTAECSHSFHFQCIASNVKHGNRICPVCRAKWKEVPLRGPSVERRARNNPANWVQDNPVMTLIHHLPSPRPNSLRHSAPLCQDSEPAVFNDDESLDLQPNLHKSSSDAFIQRKVSTKTYTEIPAVPKLSALDKFTVLLHLKAPDSASGLKPNTNQATFSHLAQTPRAPVDLVTVLDISGSMAGTKLALLKRAMGFVIQNLGPSDRLAVIAFSSTARRIFPLRKMSGTGKLQALQAVNSLVANGGTNIAEGLRKGAKVIEDRREKNPVASIILLSDGQDTYNFGNHNREQSDYQVLLPISIQGKGSFSLKIPVHAFGFGTDHDASSMHSISEISGGTFSFIETESVIQDAFAQCIGGLLSVVVKNLRVTIESVHPKVLLGSLQAGSYTNRLKSDCKTGYIDVGELYADEERDFLVSFNVPTELSSDETSLLKIKCSYEDPLAKETVALESEEVRLKRPEVAGEEKVSVEVDRQRNRLQAADAMTQARKLAEDADLAGAVSLLENCRKDLSKSVSAKSNDKLCVALDAELKEMQERMASRHVYEVSGRAYILSGMSSHSWQRATARGDSTDASSLVQAYQTPSMVEMLSRSQSHLLGSPSSQRLGRSWSAFPLQPKPR